MFLACRPMMSPWEGIISAVVPLAILVLGVRESIRRVGALLEPDRAEGLTALGVAFAAVDALLGATVVQIAASATGLARGLGQLAFLPEEVVVFTSAWVGCALVSLAFQAHVGSRRGSARGVAKEIGRIAGLAGLAGLVLGLLCRDPIELGIASFVLGMIAATIGAVVARYRAPRPLPATPPREPVAAQLVAVLRALPRTLERGTPAALVGCALSALPAAALFATFRVLLHTGHAPAFDRILGKLATLAVLATATAVLLPAHAIALAAFTAAARGERCSILSSVRRGLHLARRIAPATFLLLATPIVWQVVVSIWAHRFVWSCAGPLGLFFVYPFLWFFTRYAFLGAALALEHDQGRALALAGEERLARGGVLGLILLVPVLLLAFTPTHSATLEPEIRWLGLVLPSAESDSEAWLRVGRVLSRSFAEHPWALALEAGRITLAIVLGSGVACAALQALRTPAARHDAPRTLVLDKMRPREVKRSAPGRSGVQGSVGVR